MMKTQELSVTRVLRTLLPAAIVFALAACDQDGGTAQAPAPQVTEAVAAAPVGTAAAPAGQAAGKTAGNSEPVRVNPVTTPSISTTASTSASKAALPEAPSGFRTAPTKDDQNPGPRNSGIDLAQKLDMTLTPSTLVLGIMQPGVPKTGTVTITNNGDTPIQIKKAIASCGCTTPVWPREPIGPGESAELEITLKPTTKQGSKLSKRVTLQMVNGAPQVITVEGEVGLFVRMTPNFLDAGKQEESDQQAIVLSSENKIRSSPSSLPYSAGSAERRSLITNW
jgi:hypothetical protein